MMAFSLDAKTVIVHQDRLLGKGRLGGCYYGECRNQSIAVKVISYQDESHQDTKKQALGAALEELQNIVAHSNILVYMGVADDVTNSRFLIVSPIISRGSLTRVLYKSDASSVTFHRRMKIGEGILKGLRWLHNSSPVMFHGELKASNILIEDDWSPKLAGYGMSTFPTPPRTVLSRGSSGLANYEKNIVTIASYSAPECLLSGVSRKSTAADIFSYGCLMWELLVVQQPWKNLNYDEICLKLKRMERLPMPQETFAGLTQMINHCWQEDPDQRPTAEQLYKSGFRPGDDEILGIGIINRAILDHELGFDKLGMKAWDSLVGLHEAPWSMFAQSLADTLQIVFDDNDAKWRMLYHLVTTVTGDNAKLIAWKQALLWFGPLHETEFFRKLLSTVSHQWFHGSITRDEADDAVTAHGKNGCYLVRFSTQPGCYTITALKKKKKEWVVENYRIARKDGGLTINGKDFFADVGSLIAKHKKELGLKTICPGSKYVYAQLRSQLVSSDTLFFEQTDIL